MAKKFTLLIDDRDIEVFGISLVSYEAQSYLSRKVTGVDVPGAHGTQPVPSRLASSNFLAKVVCVGKNADEVKNRLRQFFAFMYSTEEAHKFVFTDDPSVVRYAILESPDNYKVIEGIDNAMAELKLSFLMLNPFMYQNDNENFSITAAHGEEIVIVNEAFECPAIYRLTNNGTGTVTGVSLIVNGELSNFLCALLPGDEVVLDTNEYEVRYRNEVRLDFWHGEMPLLKNGDNVIVQQNSEHADLTLSVEFTKQWV